MKLADRSQPKLQRKYKHLIPLAELIADVEGVGKNSKTVEQKYNQLINSFGSELDILEGKYDQQLTRYPDIYNSILAMREGRVEIEEGFDGQYGVIKTKGKTGASQEKMF